MIAILTPLSFLLGNLETNSDRSEFLGYRSHSGSFYQANDPENEWTTGKKVNTGLGVSLENSDPRRPRASSFQFYDSDGQPPSESKLDRYRRLSECVQLSPEPKEEGNQGDSCFSDRKMKRGQETQGINEEEEGVYESNGPCFVQKASGDNGTNCKDGA